MLTCAILCGGLATRLRPATTKIPKSLLPINGSPFIAYQLSLLQVRGISRVVLCVGHLGDQINDFVGNGSRFGLDISYSFDGAKLLGTGGAIRHALPLLGDEFFVLYGDSYLTCNYQAVADAFRLSGKPALMTIYRNDDRYDASNVEVLGDRIVRYDKRNRTPGMNYIDYGLGVFARTAFELLPEGDSADLAGIYRALLASGDLASLDVKQRFYEIGSSEGIQAFERYLVSGGNSLVKMSDKSTI
jgi:N-acetyl-alpha-D-muramate 1-phosphate uridylyltransferase